MPVTILLKAIGMDTEAILAHFFEFDHIEVLNEGARLQFVPKHWRGEVANFDITDRDGNVIVEKDKRINARHVRLLEEAKVDWLSMPDRSEEHTSELQSRGHLVCRLLLEKKKSNSMLVDMTAKALT